jgi:hypothetical protein
MDVHSSDLNQVLPHTVPVSRARDDLKVSSTSSIPRHCKAGTLGRVRHDRFWGSEFLAFHPWTSQGATHARGRRFVQGGITLKLADQREVTPVSTTNPGGLAGVIARIPHNIAGGRAHAIAMACLAEGVGARAPCDCSIPGQQYRSRRHHIE